MLLFAILPAAVQAQASDSQGNYYRNETTVQALSQNSRLASGSLWQVVVDSLNCRSSASIDSPVIREYLYGSLLEVEVYRGGSDEVFVNALDENGRPWMPVRGKDPVSKCFVRANSRYIQPVTQR